MVGNVSRSGRVEEPVGRHPRNRQKQAVTDKGKYALTKYSIVKKYGNYTHLEVNLETGRTHQIRAHLKHIGHPLFNDLEYGGDKVLKGTSFTKYKQFVVYCFRLFPGQALHAKSLGFLHPTLNKEVNFDSELPDYFLEVLNKWRRYTNSSTF